MPGESPAKAISESLMSHAILSEARKAFHSALLANVLRVNEKGVPSNADKHSRSSIRLARGIVDQIEGTASIRSRLAAQIAGADFERVCVDFVALVFKQLTHLRPGTWVIEKPGGGRLAIAQFDQYAHLASLDHIARKNPELAAALGSDYLIKPDIIIARKPEPDAVINMDQLIVDENTGQLTSLRAVNNPNLILHASISCKWTIRSDRAQNARSEGLNLVRNRKGRLPHIVAITAEPMPNRIASIALGTGDIDCVYHFALPELVRAAQAAGYEDASEMLATMIDGKRLRDISDLPLDLVI